MTHASYWRAEPGLWTVGYERDGRQDPMTDHDSEAEAIERVRVLNGGAPAPAEMVGDLHAFTGPHDDHVEVEERHRAAVLAVLPGVPMKVGNVVAQMLADAEANGARAGYDDGNRDGREDATRGVLIVTEQEVRDLATGQHRGPRRAGQGVGSGIRRRGP